MIRNLAPLASRALRSPPLPQELRKFVAFQVCCGQAGYGVNLGLATSDARSASRSLFTTWAKSPRDTASSVSSPGHRFHATCMAAETFVVVPDMGDSITEGSIAEVLKSAGDVVQMDDVVAQIETDKVTIDIRAPFAGTIKGIMANVGDTVIVGQRVLSLDASEAGTAPVATAAATAPAPDLGESALDMSTPYKGSSAIRRSMIKFPKRRTAAGVALSSLAPAEAAAELAKLMESSPLAPPYLQAPLVAAVKVPKPVVKFYARGPPPLAVSEEEIATVELGGANMLM